MSRSTGFTLVEWLLVATVIAIVATMAIPNLFSARQDAKESSWSADSGPWSR